MVTSEWPCQSDFTSIILLDCPGLYRLDLRAERKYALMNQSFYTEISFFFYLDTITRNFIQGYCTAWLGQGKYIQDKKY